MRLKPNKQKIVLQTYPFAVEEIDFVNASSGLPLSHPYHRLLCPDWINVLPITQDGRAILIKQFRAGCMDVVLETPGGEVDKEDPDPLFTAKRELEEETGYTSERIVHLASMNPNPALQNNRLHSFVALDCYLPASRRHFPDANEQISTQLVEISELDSLVRHGVINHALAALTIMLAQKVLYPDN